MNRKICPRCFSDNVSAVKIGDGILMFDTVWNCGDCGHRNAFFPEAVDEE